MGETAQGTPTNPPYPTPERLSASQIGSIAAEHGVPSSLADAIAWQESGFNNDLVSSADARGIMQILPGTWDWIQRTLTPSVPLAPASATDNVRGGVLLLALAAELDRRQRRDRRCGLLPGPVVGAPERAVLGHRAVRPQRAGAPAAVRRRLIP